MSLVADYITQLGGYAMAKEKAAVWLFNHGENWRNVKDATLLEYRREMNMYEVGDYVFTKDPHYTELWLVTNILDDGRIELKTASHGFPVPAHCWGLYYGMADGLIHATDAEIAAQKRLGKDAGEKHEQ